MPQVASEEGRKKKSRQRRLQKRKKTLKSHSEVSINFNLPYTASDLLRKIFQIFIFDLIRSDKSLNSFPHPL